MVSRLESVHLSHFDGSPGAVPPRVRKLLAFYGDLARFGSLTESGRVRRTPIQCRRRPNRKQCRGLLSVRRRDLPAVVEWECPECSTAGQISGWEGTDADLRRFDIAPAGKARPAIVSVPAHAALRDLARADDRLVPLAYRAEVDDASHPVLLITAAESLRDSSALLRYAVSESSARRCERLAELAHALASVAEELEPEVEPLEMDGAMADALVDAMMTLGDLLECETVPEQPRRQSKAKKRRQAEPGTFQIKVTLRDVKPPVWRRLLVPADISLPKLHDVLQAAMGWYDCHLHMFRVGRQAFAPPGDWEPLGEDSRGVSLHEIAPDKGTRVVYEYDFGDGWCHDIVVEDVIGDRCSSVRCTKGKRRCPPEDCGGPWGYEELREALADPTHERHEELREWAPEDFDPEDFDLADTDRVVRAVRL